MRRAPHLARLTVYNTCDNTKIKICYEKKIRKSLWEGVMSFFVRVTFANIYAIRLFETTAAYRVCFFLTSHKWRIKIKVVALFVIFYQQESRMFQPSANLDSTTIIPTHFVIYRPAPWSSLHRTLLRTISKFKRRKKILSMQCSRKKGNFMSYSCSDGKEIYKKAWCTCREFLSPLLELLLFRHCLCRRRRRCRIKSFSSIFPCSFGRWFQMNMELTLSVATTATQMFSSRESMFITTRPRVRYIKKQSIFI